MLDAKLVDRLVDAAGLTGKPEDGWSGRQILVMNLPRGFITCTPRDSRFSAPSCPALIGGGMLKFDTGWESFDDRKLLQKLGFTAAGATFVMVDFYGGPERLFLYPNADGFNADLIGELLTVHRKYTNQARRVA